MTEFFFWVFAAVLLGSAAMVVTSRNPVHSVLFLILAFINASALFLIAGAEFLAMILVIVYVGAVAVLFLFVVMMLDVDFAALREGFQKYAPVGFTVGAVLFFELISVLLGWQFADQAPGLVVTQIPANVSNTRALGDVIYTDYIFLFQLSGLILLVAMIGAIVLTHRQTTNVRRQNITRQQTRRVEDTLQVLQLRTGAGVKELGIYRPKVAPALLPDTHIAGHADEHVEAHHEEGGH
jgi:NADH-quinone oxidoreductase subunit J